MASMVYDKKMSIPLFSYGVRHSSMFQPH